MPVTFILGRAGAGKTHRCLADILAALQTEDTSDPLLWIVPEQATFQLERALALRSPRHGTWRAEVLSFSRLARRLFSETGREPPAVRPAARTLALRLIAGKQPELLRPFGAAARTPGFFTRLDRLVEELIAENIAPQPLAAAAAGLGSAAARARAAAIARIYAAYLDWLGPQRVDPAQWLGVLRERLARFDRLAGARVWVDGFAGLTGQELETLVTLAGVVREMRITLLLDPDSAGPAARRGVSSRLGLFDRTETTYRRLRARLREAGVALNPPILLRPQPPPRFARAEALARLEAGLAVDSFGVSVLRRAADKPGRQQADTSRGTGSRSADGHGGPDRQPAEPRSGTGLEPGGPPAARAQVRIVACETHREEIRAAARMIRREVIEADRGLRFRDFALIARDLTPLADDIADVLDEYGIPYFLDRRRALDGHVLSRFVPGLVRAVQTDFAAPEMVRLLRSGLLPLSRDEAERMEHVVLAEEVHGFELWRRSWSFSPSARELDGVRSKLFAAFEPFVAFVRAAPEHAGADWARRLHALLERLGVAGTMDRWITGARRELDWETAEYHRLAWDTLGALLEDVHAVLGAAPLSAADLAVIIEGGLRDLTVGLAPPTLDQVLVSSIERSRHPDIKVAWVLAMNEGVFPAPPPEDVLLGAEDRAALAGAGLAGLRPRREDVFAERMLAYIALTRPSQRLVVSYARVGCSGEPAHPSPLLRDVQRVLGGVAVEVGDEDDLPASLDEFADAYVAARARRDEEPRRWRRLLALREALLETDALAAGTECLRRAERYDNRPPAIADYARDAGLPASVAWSGSPSQLETYLMCPFRHFARYGLGLEARPAPVPAQEMGLEAHAILADVVGRALEDGRPAGRIDDARWIEWFEQACAERLRQRADDFARRRPQAAFLGQTQRRFLREVVLAQAHRWRRGAFVPLACERVFRVDDAGEADTLRACELPLPDGRALRIWGIIDRLDICEHAGRRYVLVCDYKSTARALGKTPLTGERLQLLTYLLAAEQALGGDGRTRPAGVLLLPLYPSVGVIDTRYAGQADADSLRMYLYRPRGLFDVTVAGLLDRELGHQPSPVAQMRLKRDGEMESHADARPAAELAAFLELARKTIRLAGAGLAAGRIEIAPLVENKTLACQTCDFKPLCRFEPLWNQARRADVALPALDDQGAAS